MNNEQLTMSNLVVVLVCLRFPLGDFTIHLITDN